MKSVAWQDMGGDWEREKVSWEGRRKGADQGSIYYGE